MDNLQSLSIDSSMKESTIMLHSVVVRSGVGSRSNLRRIFFFIYLIFFSGIVACEERGPFLVDCKLLSILVRTDEPSKFDRVVGSYQLDKKKMKLRGVRKYGWSHVVIPAYDYDAVQKFNEPFEGIRFSAKKNDVGVSVYSMTYSTMRQELSKVISAELCKTYREKQFFSFLDDSLGLDVGESDFCAGIPEKSVRMFMASVVLPIGGGKTHVYRLTNPEALLLVAATGKKTTAEFIFPSPKNIDTLDYVMVHAPEAYIIKIVNALKKV
jgi:hypothetical protein